MPRRSFDAALRRTIEWKRAHPDQFSPTRLVVVFPTPQLYLLRTAAIPRCRLKKWHGRPAREITRKMRVPQSDTCAAQTDSMKSGRYPLLSLKSRSWIPYAVFGGALIVTFVAALYVHRTTQAKDRARFENSVRQVSTTLQNRLDTHVALLRAGTGLFAASTTVEPDEFHKFVNQLDLPNHYPGIQGIGFSLKLQPEQREQVIEQMRKAGNPDFRIWPEGDRSEYHTIIYLEPSDQRNRAAIGF
ncbi:MAG TPA: CHASE domain-containing protein, partial [Pyrinomonadaceae bacterium]|nr:CHASE domain-containing protein [Pyrinomonadaceae bacterium]